MNTASHDNSSTVSGNQNADLQQSLIAAHGKRVRHNGRNYKLDCRMINGRFFCDAQNMTPRDDNEAKYCFTDLWKSDSNNAQNLLMKFAAIGADNL